MPITQELLDHMDMILDAYAQPALVVHRPVLQKGNPWPRSRFGGLPTLPQEKEWPYGPYYADHHIGGQPPLTAPLTFLAQIDCTDVHKYDPRFPSEGMLFFFASLNAEMEAQTTDGKPAFAVVYCENVPFDTPEREPPADIPPVRTSDESSVILPEEPGQPAYYREAMFIRPTTSYPPFSAFDPYDWAKLTHNVPWPRGLLPFTFEEASLTELFQAYGHRYKWRTLAAAVASIEYLPNPPYDHYPLDLYDKLSCTAALHFIARALVNKAVWSPKYLRDHDKNIEVLNRVEQEARAWLAAAPAFNDEKLELADKRAFVQWLESIKELGSRANRAVQDAINTGSAHASAQGYGPNAQYLYGQPRRIYTLDYNSNGLSRSRLSVHPLLCQIGGWFPSMHHAPSIHDPRVGLFHIDSIGMRNGDGHVQFWISPEDLAEHRFELAWATESVD